MNEDLDSFMIIAVHSKSELMSISSLAADDLLIETPGIPLKQSALHAEIQLAAMALSLENDTKWDTVA